MIKTKILLWIGLFFTFAFSISYFIVSNWKELRK
jgi:hypothetical protein